MGQRWVVSGFAAEVHLSVISETVQVQVLNDMSKGRQARNEEQGDEN